MHRSKLLDHFQIAHLLSLSTIDKAKFLNFRFRLLSTMRSIRPTLHQLRRIVLKFGVNSEVFSTHATITYMGSFVCDFRCFVANWTTAKKNFSTLFFDRPLRTFGYIVIFQRSFCWSLLSFREGMLCKNSMFTFCWRVDYLWFEWSYGVFIRSTIN